MREPSPLRSHPDGVALTVWVVPGARRSEITGLYGDALRMRIAAPAEEGRANRAVIEILRVTFGTDVRLMGGAVSRRKRFLLHGMTAAAATEIIDGLGR
ncbi:MAG: DUF167 domain-containing protein [Acidimicrobiia bacterium]|jgi:hypothetical protein